MRISTESIVPFVGKPDKPMSKMLLVFLLVVTGGACYSQAGGSSPDIYKSVPGVEKTGRLGMEPARGLKTFDLRDPDDPSVAKHF